MAPVNAMCIGTTFRSTASAATTVAPVTAERQQPCFLRVNARVRAAGAPIPAADRADYCGLTRSVSANITEKK
ncbi:hypothetical protein GCM10009660_61190 [Catellatospora bangladeshensis]